MVWTIRINILQCLLFLITVIFSGCYEKEDLPPPNILWIVSEDNGPFLGCYGDSIATTPYLDKLAAEGISYTRAYANAPVCAPARATLITGMYPIALGVENMRSTYPIPDFVKFYPHYLKEAGYYTTNNNKKDYNTSDQPEVWDESSKEASYENRKHGQPFFHIINLGTTHESRLHWDSIARYHQPEHIRLPPYHPDTKAMRNDWAVYYDRVRDMDRQVGEVLNKLEAAGLAESTIVFYYSDHGGALARSKRFLFESGLRVPLIVRIPKKYQHLAPQAMGTRSDQLVSFVDFASTLLNLAGQPVPDYMQGSPFLGQDIPKPKPYAFSFRGRMDERIDLSRSVTDGRYRYTRNFMPHRPYAQYLEYLWKAPSMQSWESTFRAGQLNSVQQAFFLPKPYEELYDITNDPHNVHNLADSPDHQAELGRLREALDQWQVNNRDAGLMPEAFLDSLSQQGTIYGKTQGDNYPVETILEAAKRAASRSTENLDTLIRLLQHNNANIRYWAAAGLLILGDDARQAQEQLHGALGDPSPVVSITAAEALFHLDQKDTALRHLIGMLQHDRMMVRLQALNVLDLVGEDARKALPAIRKEIRPRQDREYDNRAMWGMMEKFGNAEEHL